MKIRTATILLPAALSICAVMAAQTDPGDSFPSEITTRDGRVYRHVERLRTEPDGLLVNYEPAPGGYGLAKLKFRDLPDDLRRRYGYDEKKSSDYEAQQAQAVGSWMHARAAEETAMIRYRDLAEFHRSLAGDESVSYTAALETNGTVSAHGFTQTAPSQTVTNVGLSDYANPYYRGGWFGNGIYSPPYVIQRNLPPGMQ